MKSKVILIVTAVAVIVSGVLTGCGLIPVPEPETTTVTTTTTTTTTSTTATTTENLDTTFPENSTRKIYKGLKKDTDGDFDYKIAEYSTYYRSSDTTRTANLKAAAEKLNNIVIPNDAYFSFNQTVGKRTVTAGYEEAKVIKDGEFVDGLGGGVCQVSSTVFEAVLRANVEIIERGNHTLEIGYVPLGGDATVQWNSRDFQFKNTTGSKLRLKMKCENGKLTCSVWAKKDIDVGDVSVNISKSGSNYILTRTVDGKRNYRTVSHYSKAKD